jgi:DNA-binding CsgD family transcriptional regulator/PAS domain-containing protein
MTHRKPGALRVTGDFERLRKKAEELLRHKPVAAANDSADLLRMIHELQIYQAEVEIQNEELRQAHEELGELQRFFEDLYEYAPCGYLKLDPQGAIIRSNQAGTMLVQDVRTRVLHAAFIRFLDPASEGAYFTALRETATTGGRRGLELHLGGSRGADRWVWAELLADRTPSGEVQGYRLTLVDISEKKATERVLAESERKYRRLFADTICGALLLEVTGRDSSGCPEGARIVEVNNGFVRLTGFAAEVAVGSGLDPLWPDSGAVWLNAIERALESGRAVEVDHYHRELGRHLLMSFFLLEGDRIGVTMLDISAGKQTEHKLDRARRDLEIVVRERSDELLEINAELSEEVKDHVATQLKLVEKTEELQSRLVELGEVNAALQVLLKAGDGERAKLEEEMVCNINELVRPHLAKLAEGKLGDRQAALLEAIGRSLDEITSPLSRRFILEASRLTPIESQVAELIRQGKSTKEIATLMGVAGSTVDYHRLNIRRRLGLTKKGLNLQSYLKSLG